MAINVDIERAKSFSRELFFDFNQSVIQIWMHCFLVKEKQTFLRDVN